MKTIARLLIFFSLLMVAIPGCRDTGLNADHSGNINAHELFTRQHYAVENRRSGLSWISDAVAFEQFCRRFPRKTIGSGDCGSYAVDFEHEGVLVIDMGTKNTSGYSLGLAQSRVPVLDGTAVVTVEWMEPPPDAFLAQVITHPCMAVKLPNTGFTKIRVVDQTGRNRGELALP
ncbi:MAG: protease complex subunit PrcB family protein [Desulfobacteraceae bacterium]|nr:protease complex subunit PrcB family protein [Desulfobacteraceae bacterium]